MTSCKIANWNLCLGLPNKKDLVKKTQNNENIDVYFMQETDFVLIYLYG